MSQINDALKRAKEAQQDNPPPAHAPQFIPPDPAQQATRGIGLAVPFAFVVIALLGLLFAWEIRQKKSAANQSPAQTETVAVTQSASETKPQPTALIQSAPAVAPKPIVASKASAATSNPEGVPEISPGLRRDAGRFPGEASHELVSNPERVAEHPILSNRVPQLSVAAAPPTISVVPTPPPAPLKLQAILFDPKSSSAMINGRMVIKGDKVNEFLVASIGQSRVTLVSSHQTNVLTLNR